MKLQVPKFVTTQKPEIRGRSQNSAYRAAHCAGQDAVVRDGPGNAARRVDVPGREALEGAASVMQRAQPAVWTLENVPALFNYFRGKFATCYIFDANKYSKCGQSRRRLLLSNRVLHIPKLDVNPLTMRDVMGEVKGWNPGQYLIQRNGYGNVKSVDLPSFTVTSGYLQAGAMYVGDLDDSHILTSDDRARLQGFTEPIVWPAHIKETKRKAYVAQCVALPFAEAISVAAFSYQKACLEAELTSRKLAQLEEMSEADAFMLACSYADERMSDKPA